jgi:uncharacterized protein YdiU (UPF0061 family)
MNTDNMSIAGETIDYGPCAFMDTYHPATVYSSIDHGGRYAYGNQPRIAQWNLSRLAQSLLPLIDEDRSTAVDEAQAAIDAFPERFEQAYLNRFRAKLGMLEEYTDDADLIGALFKVMAQTSADFTNTFRALCDAAEGADSGVRIELGDSTAGNDWLGSWRARLARETAETAARTIEMRQANPAVIPRNHCVEATLNAAVEGDLDPLEDFLKVLASPWDEHPGSLPYRCPPEPHEVVHQTFCGT